MTMKLFWTHRVTALYVFAAAAVLIACAVR